MADFAYSARDAGGKLISSNLQATDRKEALRKIRSRGLTPIKVATGGGSVAVKPSKAKVRETKKAKAAAQEKIF